jgi:uncharacterized RDD family membrane protein YckC
MYCSTCNAESGPTLFCHVCDNYLPNPATGLKAGLVRRFVAVIVDNLLAFTILVLSIRWLLSINGNPTSSAQMVIILVSCLALLAYGIAFFVSLSHGMTPGKWILGIRAIDKRNGEAPGLGRMLVRELIGKLVSGFFAGLGFFWAIWDRDSQAWHDKLAGTVVVRSDTAFSNERTTAWPATACVAFFAVCGLQMFAVLDPSWSAVPNQLTTTVATQPVKPEYWPTLPPSESQANTASIPVESTPTGDESIAHADVSPPPAAGLTDSEQQQDTEIQAKISTMLTHWAAAIEANDPSTAASYYGETVSRYFLARNVTRADVLQNKEASLEKGMRFVSFGLEQINFDQISSAAAIVSLVKSYQVINPDTSSTGATVHSRLWLENTDAGWKITGEQDLLK